MPEKDDDEIVIDFSKIKKFFKGKSETDKVKSAETEANNVKAEVKREVSEAENKENVLKEDIEKIEKVESELKKEGKEAMIVDGEKNVIEKKINEDKKQIEDIKEDLDGDEEISFDFSKIKNSFKGLKNIFKDDKSSRKSSEDEISFDYKKGLEFIKKYHLLLLIIIPLLFSIYLRAMPAYLPITDDWAQSSIVNNIRSQINTEIRSQNPNLPDTHINSIVDQRLNEVLKTQKSTISQQKAQVSDFFKSKLKKDIISKDGEIIGQQTYLLAIDPYFWMRHAKNILENGHVGDELRDKITGETCSKVSETCVPWNTHMFAPLGREVPPDRFHSYFEAYFHKFLSIFNPNQDLMSSVFIIPILLSALTVIPAFFIARKISGDFGGFVAALILAIHPGFLTRTAGGFADTDPYNVLFPLFITWIFLEAFEARSNFKKSIVFSAISGFLAFVYMFAWGGWWYIFDFILVSIAIYLVVYVIRERKEVKKLLKDSIIKHALLVFAIFILTPLLISLFTGNFDTFSTAFDGPGRFIRLKEVGIATVWPNVFTTVAEQNTASLDNVIKQIGLGNIFLFMLAIIGISLTLVERKSNNRKDLYYFIMTVVWLIIVIAINPQNLILFLTLIFLPMIIKMVIDIYKGNNKIDFKLAIILMIWFASTTFASTKGVRFLLLLVPAFSIGLGIALGFAYRYTSNFLIKSLDLNKLLARTVIIIALLFMLVIPFNAAVNTAKTEIPSMNDAWYNSLENIRLNSEPDAIINSWWDFGHWFKAVADRAVTFDGTSQNTPMAHWIGNSLLTNDEEKAMGILRMLDCGSNNAFEELNKEINDTAKSVYILQDIVKLNKEDARNYLLDFVDEGTTEKVLQYSHCDPPEDYYITSDDMIGKSGVWGHFGIWDFNRSLIYNTLKKSQYSNNKDKSISFLMNRFNMDENSAESMYSEVRSIRNSDDANTWISPWPSYASQNIRCSQEVDRKIVCPIPINQNAKINAFIDLDKKSINITTTRGNVYPNDLVIPNERGIDKVSFNENLLGFSMTLIPSENGWSYILSSPPLVDSMFTRLYFLDGHGLKNFEKFSEQTSVTGNRIVVWKVDWKGTQENILPYFQKNLNQSEVSDIDLGNQETNESAGTE